MKRNILKRIISVVLIGTMVFSLTACGGNHSKNETEISEEGSKDTLVYGIGTAPEGVFQPIVYNGDWDRDIIYMTHSRLLSVDENVNFVYDNDLTDHYEISDDDKEITFYLKEGIKWSDGEDFTAEDVAFTFTSMDDANYPQGQDPVVSRLVGAKDYYEGKAESVSGIQVIDNTTIKFVYEDIYAGALSRFAEIPICAKHVWGDIPVENWLNQTELLTNPVGTGPFKVSEYVSGQSVTLVPNGEFFGEAPKLNEFIFKVINQDNAQAALASGEIDLVELTKINDEDLKPYEDAGFQIITYDNSVIWWNSLNLHQEKLQDVRIRQAINYAIDAQTIVDKVLDGTAKVPTGSFPVSSPYSEGIDTYEYNPDKAAELLGEAGYKDTDGDGILEKDGKPLTLSYVYCSDNKIREEYALMTQQYLKAVGIDVIMNDMDFNSLVSEMFDPDSEKYEMGLMGASLRIDPSKCGSTTAQFSHIDEEKDYIDLQNAVDTTMDLEKRKEAAAEWSNYRAEQSDTIYLYGLPRAFAANPDLHMVSYMYEYCSHANEWYFD